MEKKLRICGANKIRAFHKGFGSNIFFPQYRNSLFGSLKLSHDIPNATDMIMSVEYLEKIIEREQI